MRVRGSLLQERRSNLLLQLFCNCYSAPCYSFLLQCRVCRLCGSSDLYYGEKEEFQHTAYATNAYVTIGPLWNQVLQGKKPVKLEICVAQKQNDDRNKKTSKRGLSSVLESKLDELRKEISSNEDVTFPHAVLSTQQIALLSIQKPTSIPELEKLVGKLKAEKYGSRIAEVIKNYVNEEQPNCKATDADKGNENEFIKRRRKNKSPVIIDSSGDEND